MARCSVLAATCMAVSLSASINIMASDGHGTTGFGPGPAPDSHAPIGVMGDHTHKTGEMMISYRVMTMDMEDNLRGSDSISASEIAQTLANPFGPPTARVVPLKMRTTMHMLGMMFAPSDQLTLMLMLNYLEKEMDHITFSGAAGTTELGRFTTETQGIGDTKVAGLFQISETAHANMHFNLGLSIPTGSIEETDQILTPTGSTPSPRLPYPMQLGSGTYDLEPGITYNAHSDVWRWGAQAKVVHRFGKNDADYRLGNQYMATGWASYRFAAPASVSARLEAKSIEAIEGSDSQIAAPVQTANIINSGGDSVNFGLGINLIGREGALEGHRLLVEYTVPVYQKVNGVQMEMQNMATLGYQYAF